LVGRIDTAAKDPPLTAVGMTRNEQVNVIGAEIAVKILGMVTEEQLIARLLGVGLDPIVHGHSAGIQKSRTEAANGDAAKGDPVLVHEDGTCFSDDLLPRGVNTSLPGGEVGGVALTQLHFDQLKEQYDIVPTSLTFGSVDYCVMTATDNSTLAQIADMEIKELWESGEMRNLHSQYGL